MSIALKRNFILLIILWSLPYLKGQDQIQPVFINKPVFSLGTGLEFMRFKGDYGIINYTNNSPALILQPKVTYKSWGLSLPLRLNNLTWNDRSGESLANFRTKFQALDLRLSYRFFKNPNSISPIAAVGYGRIMYSVFEDSKDNANNAYFLWSDGKIRDVEESNSSFSNANIIERDYTYESEIISNNTIGQIPISIGLSGALSSKLQLSAMFTQYLLQGDNLDGNFFEQGWDRLSAIEVSIVYNLFGKKKSTKDVESSKRIVDYSSVNYTIIDMEDEDSDGVLDIDDHCFGTPKGAQVDDKGCPIDTDGDGIIDFLDAEPNSPSNSRVHQNGTAWTDEEYLIHYNDSLAYFVNTLRKINKNSRPYPVKKFIPNENLILWNKILEANPEWQIARLNGAEKLPKELRFIDRNKDNFLSNEELKIALDDFFDNSKSKVNEDLLRKAIEHAFRNQ